MGKLYEIAWSSSPNDLWNLMQLTPHTLRIIYCDQLYWGSDALGWQSVRSQRKKFRRLTNAGLKDMPRRTEEYQGPEEERESVRQRRSLNAPKVGEAALSQYISEADRIKLHKQLDDALDSANIGPEQIEQVRIKKISKWEMGYKDTEGEAQSHPLVGLQLELDPKKYTPEWVPVSRVESVKLPKRERKETDALRKSRRAVILPDMQFPHQDTEAIDTALQIITDAKPDKVIILGDLLDLAAFSKYEQRPEFAAYTQQAIIEAHQLLATLRKLAPTAEISVHEGNHDARMTKSILRNAMQAFGLKRADQPEGWPVLSVPFLTAMDTLDIDYISGYPANKQYINQNLQVRHGHLVRSRGSTAKAVSDDERVSTIFGHVHRIETQMKTHDVYEGGKTNAAHSIGCLCKIDGTVPSVNSGVDLRGKPVQSYENWQQGICVVDYEDGDGPFQVQTLYINTFNGYETYYNGKRYAARENV